MRMKKYDHYTNNIESIFFKFLYVIFELSNEFYLFQIKTTCSQFFAPFDSHTVLENLLYSENANNSFWVNQLFL